MIFVLKEGKKERKKERKKEIQRINKGISNFPMYDREVLGTP